MELPVLLPASIAISQLLTLKREENHLGQKIIGQKIITKNSVALDISGPIDHMIAICGTQVSKMAENDKKLSPYLKKHTSYDRYFCCTCVKQ